jgi:hypothetical protein
MKPSTSVRRTVSVVASVALAAGVAWLPAGPASAAVHAEFTAEGNADTSSDCALTSGDASPESTPATFSHGKKSRSVALDATFTATGDPTDVVHATGHYGGTMVLKKKGPHLSRAVLSGSGAVSIDRTKGNSTVCDPDAAIALLSEMEFSEGSAGWLYLQRSTVSKPGLTEMIVAKSLSSSNAVIFEIYQGGASQASTRAFVKPGGFQAVMAVGLSAGNFILLKGAPHSSLSLVFHRAGSALTGTKGAGASYVEFPGSVSCGSSKATLRWKPSASHVAAGGFFVNGKKKAFDATPQGGEKVVLKHLSAKADVKITAKLQLKGGGSATATRAYVPCKG